MHRTASSNLTFRASHLGKSDLAVTLDELEPLRRENEDHPDWSERQKVKRTKRPW